MPYGEQSPQEDTQWSTNGLPIGLMIYFKQTYFYEIKSPDCDLKEKFTSK